MGTIKEDINTIISSTASAVVPSVISQALQYQLNNVQFDQDNDIVEECKEQQDTIFSSTSSAAVPRVIFQALQ